MVIPMACNEDNQFYMYIVWNSEGISACITDMHPYFIMIQATNSQISACVCTTLTLVLQGKLLTQGDPLNWP